MGLGKTLLKNLRRKQRLLWDWSLLAIAPSATVLLIALGQAGTLQALEWAALDQLFCLRPPEAPDQRVMILTISDEDITTLGTWPISDNVLATTLRKLKRHKPRVIALDIYRDLPVEPGHQQLNQLFKTTPNLIGAEKRFGHRKVPPPKILAKLNQIGAIDTIEDADGRIRRGLLSGQDSSNKVFLSLGAKAALAYLEKENIAPQPNKDNTYDLGRARIFPFQGNDGGYVRADSGGYQILLNFRGPQERFQTLPLSDVLSDRMSDELIRDRIVFIGYTAESANDFVRTPYDGHSVTQFLRTPGVFIHANLASQLLSSALEGRSFLQTIPDPLEWVWLLIWVSVSLVVSRKILQAPWLNKHLSYAIWFVGILTTELGLLLTSYLLFILSWWIPIVAPMLGILVSSVMTLIWYGQKLQRLAYFDGLTQIANRRYFDQRLAQYAQNPGTLSLILCDVDCFKIYNDTYGHQAGDVCLQQVASALRRAVRRNDIVARYGGEEFAVILPNTDLAAAAMVAERILNQVRSLKLEHKNSTAKKHVTLSCGVTCVLVNRQRLQSVTWSFSELIAEADGALYQSKKEGRDRYTLIQKDNPEQWVNEE
jgi:diguanylate cyclase (GGDEF)-like protein